MSRIGQAPGTLLVMGAGSVGCYLGGCLQAAGAPVSFVGRPRVLQALADHGLHLTDLDGGDHRLPPAALDLHPHVPSGLAPSLVLLCVKSPATRDAALELGQRLPPGTPVLSMQNGVANAEIASAAAPALQVLPGMVPFNIAEVGPGHYHRGTEGRLAAQAAPALTPWPAWFARAGLPLTLHDDLRPLQWGKLLLNLNNPVNALSGLPLRAQLLDRHHRRLFADLVDEALSAMRAAGITPQRLTPLPWAWLPTLLRLPTPLFRRLAASMLRIDAHARSSMADDLAQGRPTEVDMLCGEVVRLAARLGRKAPCNAEMQARVEAASGHR
ncbi:2-dehydropantoate 2-reductase [Caldimonas brevitalea]|uniref:2-dehydropantoate 2-reductase n=1 Tax=Caldimonas brevitalea TaxID=413882 RepID=A0A0G3BDN8_9BURK|nr:2-dehydropantoate 2-reductase [Caldimonas brevitalea]AKJ27534.1 2-dehydropantoate 2-reductase [Caldimonas brevitalea]